MNRAVGAPGLLTQEQIDALVSEATDAIAGESARDVWSWRFTGTEIELHAELRPAFDPESRALLLACGSVLLNLKVLVRGLGVHSSVRLLPDATQHDLIAAVRLEGPRPVTEQDRSMVAAVFGSVPPRLPNAPTEPDGSTINTLRRVAKAEQAWLAVQTWADILGAIPNPDSMRSIGTALVIGTVLDGLGAQLQAGQATQRVALTAATMGRPAKTMPQVLQQAGNRHALRELIGGGLWPQAVLDLPPARRFSQA